MLTGTFLCSGLLFACLLLHFLRGKFRIWLFLTWPGITFLCTLLASPFRYAYAYHRAQPVSPPMENHFRFLPFGVEFPQSLYFLFQCLWLCSHLSPSVKGKFLEATVLPSFVPRALAFSRAPYMSKAWMKGVLDPNFWRRMPTSDSHHDAFIFPSWLRLALPQPQ